MKVSDMLQEHGAEPVSSESSHIFVDRVLATFANFYTGDDVEEHVNNLQGFGYDAKAVINYIYGALLDQGLDLGEFIDATKLLEPEDKKV